MTLGRTPNTHSRGQNGRRRIRLFRPGGKPGCNHQFRAAQRRHRCTSILSDRGVLEEVALPTITCEAQTSGGKANAKTILNRMNGTSCCFQAEKMNISSAFNPSVTLLDYSGD